MRSRSVTYLILTVIGTVLVLNTELRGQTGIVGTLHNLSVAGPGSFKASAEDRVCLFCHTPHHASAETPPMWNRNLSMAGYSPYQSSSLQATPGQPTGYSKLCLSCHDGTIALGSVLSRNGSPTVLGGLESPLAGASTVIGIDLTNDHPVSFVYDQFLAQDDGELVDPSGLTGAIHLWPGTSLPLKDNLQCSSCHDAHESRSPKFLRKLSTGQADNLCLTCHAKTAWPASTHANATTFFPSGQTQTTVQDHSCRACHHPHAEVGAERLLDGGVSGGVSAIEETCYRCHQPAGSGGVAADIRTEFTGKLSSHPIAEYGGHQPIIITEPALGLPEGVLLSPGQPSPNPILTDTKHVECTDCHNPHQVTSSNRTEGVKGIGLDGLVVNNVVNDPELPDGTQKQYQLCLRCHGDSYSGFIASRFVGSSPLRTVVGEPASLNTSGSNKRIEFDSNDLFNTGFHPVAGAGRNQSAALAAQLTSAGLTTSSIIKCTDCHNSDATGLARGRASNSLSGPSGPHGSAFGRLLRANYTTGQPPFTPPMSEPFGFNADNFALCFLCHSNQAFDAGSRDRGDITNYYSNDRSNLHYLHLNNIDGRNGFGNAVCAECHYNPHSNRESANTLYEPPPDGDTHLINFGPSVSGFNEATPLWMYMPPSTDRYGRTSPDRPTMSCNLTCHGVDHDRVDHFHYEVRGS